MLCCFVYCVRTIIIVGRVARCLTAVVVVVGSLSVVVVVVLSVLIVVGACVPVIGVVIRFFSVSIIVVGTCAGQGEYACENRYLSKHLFY